MFSFPFAGSGRVIVAIALALVGAAPLQAQSADEKLQKDLAEGADLYFRNKPDEALKKFQEVLAQNPSNQQALDFYNRAGKEVLALMLVKGGEFETTAKRFLEIATVARKEKSDDAAAIGALVEKALSGSYLDRRDALYQLSADHGEYGAAPFVAELGDGDNAEKRVNAIYCLIHLSGDAVLPLLAALDSGNDMIVRNACACLGSIGNVRALPGLKRVVETTTSETSRAAANEALTRIAGKDASTLASAAELHVVAAMMHFKNDRSVTAAFDTKDAVWWWDGKAVVAKKVPAILRNLRLAEQHCRAALENANAQSVLLASLAGEKAALASAKDMGTADVPEPDPSIDVALASGGDAALSAALKFALENDAPMTAVELIKTLEAAGGGAAALTEALGSPYKSVRYQAAFALANGGDSSEAVVRALGDAVAEQALRNVLVVDNMSESRNATAAALRSAGYSVLTADSGGLGFARARSLPPKDVVIVRSGMPDVTLDQFVFDSDFRNSAASIVVVSDAQALDGLKALYDGKGKVKGFLTDPIATDALVGTVKAAIPELNHERAAALSAAERAAALLAKAPAASLSPIGADLVRALARSEETIVGGSLKAIGHLGSADAAPAVVAIFADAARSEAIRVAAADALGGIFAKMSSAPADDILKPVMTAAASDANAAVRLAAGRALGAAAFLGTGERAQLLREPSAK